MEDINLELGPSTFKATTSVTKKPVVKKTATPKQKKEKALMTTSTTKKPVTKVPALSDKAMLERNASDTAKVIAALCGVMKQKLLCDKAASAQEVCEVCGFNKDELQSLIETLDSIGSNTYTIACELRDLLNRMS